MASESTQKRTDGRAFDELRPVRISRNFLKFAEGSVLIEMGDTKVICAATIEDRVPPFLMGTGRGWMTAEYSMLPRSAKKRIGRESTSGKIGGRTHEIQRLIGRSLRAVFDLSKIGERTVYIDCDVIQADGGTRTASITGAYVAVYDTLFSLQDAGIIDVMPVLDSIAAVSVGVIGGRPCLDLNYEEDSKADVDMNVIMTGAGKFVEVQGTAEQAAFSRKELSSMLDFAEKGIRELFSMQKIALGREV
ncbi:MAG: ribonuclease PH [Deltaproteobacteria bacterium]|nr:ribonuclease PH [Deltaproteobacteria bacterium]